jgi:hypothetical protein
VAGSGGWLWWLALVAGSGGWLWWQEESQVQWKARSNVKFDPKVYRSMTKTQKDKLYAMCPKKDDDGDSGSAASIEKFDVRVNEKGT